MKETPTIIKQRRWRRMAIALLPLWLTACAHVPRWTPESVSPPESLTIALQSAKEAAREGKTKLSDESVQPMELTRDGAILTALARNRSLAEQQFAPGISATQIKEARAAFDPDFLATVSYGKDSSPSSSSVSRNLQANAEISNTFPTGTEVFLSGGITRSRVSSPDWDYSGAWSAGINQSLLRGAGSDVNLVTLRQAENTVAISQHELRGFVIELVEQVETAYWQLVLAEETLKIRGFAVQLAQQQLEETEDYINVEKLAQDARVSAEAELASRQADLIDAESDVKARTIDLIRLLNPENENQWSLTFETVDLPTVQDVEINPNISARLADQYSPELAQARLNLANRDLEVIRTRNGLLPVLEAFASYGHSSSGTSFAGATRSLDDTQYNNYEVGLTFQTAILNRAEKATNERAEFQVSQAEASVANLQQLIKTEVRNAAVEVERQWNLIPATQKTVESRQEELRVEQDRFRVGKSTNLDVLEVQNNLIQAQLAEVTARVQYIQALTTLYKTEGTLLERRGVGVNSEGAEGK